MNDKTQLILNFINESSSNMPYVLKYKLIRDGKKLKYRFEFEEIKNSIDEFIKGNELNDLLCCLELGGVGKTTLLYQAYYYLLNEKHILPDQIIYLPVMI